jgi:ribosomal protein S28E/S33
VIPALRITGVVRDPAGNPLGSVRLAVMPSGSHERTTGSDGKFEIMWDPSWTLPDITSILLARDRARNLVAAVDLDAQMKNLDVKLRPGVVLTGKVLDPEGGPLTSARIQITLRWPSFGVMLSRNSEAATAPDGTFTVPALPPDRQYGVTVLAEGYGRLYVGVDTHGTKDNRVELGAFKLPVANLFVSGVVVDANEKPVAGAEVFSYGPEQPERRVILTDDQGRFVIRNICAGPINVSANVPGAEGPSGSVATEGGATNVKITVSASGESGRYVPRKSASLIGKPLPSLKMAGVELPADANDRMLLVCLWDVSQRPSRHCLTQLAQRATQLGEKGVMIIAVQAARTEEGALGEWVKTNKVPFPVGRMTGDFEKTRFDWGVTSLPHLILTDKKRVVAAEGFELSELDEKILATTDKL